MPGCRSSDLIEYGINIKYMPGSEKPMNDYQDDLVANSYKFRPPYHPDFIAKLVNEVNLQRTDVPLDLLCGRGEIANHLSKYCDRIIAVDGSRQMLDRAERNEKINFLFLKFNFLFHSRKLDQNNAVVVDV